MTDQPDTDRLADELRDARCCDALEPCNRCQDLAREIRGRRRAAEVIAALSNAGKPHVPFPRPPTTTEFQRRIAGGGIHRTA